MSAVLTPAANLIGKEVTITLTNWAQRAYEGTGHVLWADADTLTFVRDGDLYGAVTIPWDAIETIELGRHRPDWIERHGLKIIGLLLLVGFILEGTVFK